MPSKPPLTKAEQEAALQALAQRSQINNLAVPRESGVYAIYLRSGRLLAPLREGADGLVYVGLSSNLAEREFDCHFSPKNTGFSSPRRSLGAILKARLALEAIPRSSGLSQKECQNYRFISDGEDRLTEWMYENLEISVYATGKYEELESFLIKRLKPLLNLTKCENQHRAQIKKLRKACADEARENRQSQKLGRAPRHS